MKPHQISFEMIDYLPNGVTSQDLEDFEMARKLARQNVLSMTSNEITKKNQSNEDIRNPKSIVIGRYEVETWYASPFPVDYLSLPKIYFCEFCLEYRKSQMQLDRHLTKCSWRHPLGDEIYRCGDISVFEVDGKKSSQYCRSLCQLSMLFLNCKILWYDIEHFFFYVMTKNDKYGSHPVGYFSKEKNYPEVGDRLNLSCVMIMPQFQKQGFGRFLIDFSYLLSRVEEIPGTPERPFSDFGRISYHSYWKSTLLEYLNRNRNSKSTTIDNIIRETGMSGQDVVEALQILGFLSRIRNCEQEKEQWALKVNWSFVDTHAAKEAKSKRIKIDPECLKWVPYRPEYDYNESDDIWETVPETPENNKNHNEPVKERRSSIIMRRKKYSLESQTENTKVAEKLENNNVIRKSMNLVTNSSETCNMVGNRNIKQMYSKDLQKMKKLMVLDFETSRKRKRDSIDSENVEKSTSENAFYDEPSKKKKKELKLLSVTNKAPLSKIINLEQNSENKENYDFGMQTEKSFIESEPLVKNKHVNMKQTKITSFF